ncbi:hypothetical protein RV04_GL001914 [Enterococcus hermanniensis]|uniref:Uncharacterized protein n=1 Tax=Enterococcus hermanniensis TaxID=249189 RepID=A0A1L8TMR1_9ENTE|nr:hypothetical protein RV04_GL001914 [Enterococcus hermanniensis]
MRYFGLLLLAGFFIWQQFQLSLKLSTLDKKQLLLFLIQQMKWGNTYEVVYFFDR